MTPADEHKLYQRRPDLWGVTRAMIHCKDTLPDVSKAVWESLPKDDKRLLKMVASGELPEEWFDDKQTV